MSNIQFGKCLKDIPMDKLSCGIRVAIKNSVGNYLAGTICYLKKDTFATVNVSGTPGVENTYKDKINSISVDWDNGPVLGYSQINCDNIYYIEETK